MTYGASLDRYGGDEYVIIALDKTEDDLRRIRDMSVIDIEHIDFVAKPE